jgi:hypothetical protein
MVFFFQKKKAKIDVPLRKIKATGHRHYKERVNDLSGSPKPSGYMKKSISVQPKPMDLESEPPVGWQDEEEDDNEVIERTLHQELLQFSQHVSVENESAEMSVRQ